MRSASAILDWNFMNIYQIHATAVLILLQEMKIIPLSLFFFHPGIAFGSENFCCRDRQTWITPDKASPY